MSYTVSFIRRDFSGPVRVGEYLFDVERLNWRAVGGPWSGRVRVTAGGGPGSLPRLWALADLLRCGVTISDQAPAWWGYLAAVEVHGPGGLLARVELDSMWNRGMCEYYSYNPVQPFGERNLTPAQQVADSIANYGYKERVFLLDGRMVSLARANLYLSTMLSRYGQPVKSLGISAPSSAGGYYAVMELRGWWETLDWRFYTDSRGWIGNTDAAYAQYVGGGTARQWAQSFTTGAEGWTCSEAWVKLHRVGWCVDNVVVDLCANNAGKPGTVLASQTYYGLSVPAEGSAWVRFGFASPPALAASTTYWLKVNRSGAASGTNYFNVLVNYGAPFSGGTAALSDDGVTWTNHGSDLGFVVVGTVDASAQISKILDASAGCGQFLSGSRIEGSVGVASIPYRDGATRGQEEIEQHLQTGTAAGTRLLARVEVDRLARVFAQPVANTAQYVVNDAGQITRQDTGGLQLSEWPAGGWVRLGSIASPGYGASGGAVAGIDAAGNLPSSVFVEACTWTPGAGFRVGDE